MQRKKVLWITIVLAALVAVLGWFSWRYLYPSYQMWRIGEDYRQFERGFTDFLKNDTYGGRTPEETYKLYFAAFKSNDAEAASRYFYWEREAMQKNKLDDLKAKGELAKYAADLPEWSEMREEEYDVEGTKQYSYEFIQEKDREYYDEVLGRNDILKAGKYRGFVDFEFNKQADIWKIFNL